MRLAIGSDHAGFTLKETIRTYLEQAGHQVYDVGTHSTEAVDYPDYARAVGLIIQRGEADLGILVCGSGVGVSIAANKMRGVRAALCHDTFSARNSREDDDANVLCLGARVIGPGLALEVVRVFLASTFSGADRHRRRVDKVIALEQEAAQEVQ
jgi:ribose 5-phosphate isomerase B